MVKKELLDRAMRQLISEQVMTLSQFEPLLSCSQRSVQRYLSKWGAFAVITIMENTFLSRLSLVLIRSESGNIRISVFPDLAISKIRSSNW